MRSLMRGSFLLLVAIWTEVSNAHPGSLDANGGHHDRINGGYHSHSGNSEKQGGPWSNGISGGGRRFVPPSPRIMSRNPHHVPHSAYFPPYWSPYRTNQKPKSTEQPESETFLSSSLEAKIIAISDGDTMLAEDSNGQRAKIRMYGIDCPEKDQAFGKEATQFTTDRCLGKTVRLELVDKDSFDRIVVKITTEELSYLNLELVSVGLAHWYREYAPKDTVLRDEEAKARAERKGLWSSPSPVLPSEYRDAGNIRARLKKRAVDR